VTSICRIADIADDSKKRGETSHRIGVAGANSGRIDELLGAHGFCGETSPNGYTQKRGMERHRAEEVRDRREGMSWRVEAPVAPHN